MHDLRRSRQIWWANTYSGASNAKLLAGIVPKTPIVFAFSQNDADGRKWLRAVADCAGVTVKHVATPEPHKDAADWCKAAATLADLDAAITAALEVKPAPVEPTHVTPADEEWPEPKPLPKDLPAVPAFDFACLPDTLRPWIEDIAERMQCPPDFPAVGAMIALGSLVGRKIGIRPKRYDDWLVIPNLWGCVVGRPGVMKTPALEQPLLPLRRLVAEAFERYEGEMQQHRVNAMLKSQRKRLAENKIQKQLKGGDEQAARAEAEAVLKNEASCNRRRAFLYLPPKASHFGCRLCHHLTYRSSQESHLIDINAQLQRLQTQFDKRMRQSSKRSTA